MVFFGDGWGYRGGKLGTTARTYSGRGTNGNSIGGRGQRLFLMVNSDDLLLLLRFGELLPGNFAPGQIFRGIGLNPLGVGFTNGTAMAFIGDIEIVANL